MARRKSNPQVDDPEIEDAMQAAERQVSLTVRIRIPALSEADAARLARELGNRVAEYADAEFDHSVLVLE
jgi:hypothetical protein